MPCCVIPITVSGTPISIGHAATTATGSPRTHHSGIRSHRSLLPRQSTGRPRVESNARKAKAPIASHCAAERCVEATSVRAVLGRSEALRRPEEVLAHLRVDEAAADAYVGALVDNGPLGDAVPEQHLRSLKRLPV